MGPFLRCVVLVNITGYGYRVCCCVKKNWYFSNYLRPFISCLYAKANQWDDGTEIRH